MSLQQGLDNSNVESNASCQSQDRMEWAVVTLGPFYSYLIPAWISRYVHYKVWAEITAAPLKFGSG